MGKHIELANTYLVLFFVVLFIVRQGVCLTEATLLVQPGLGGLCATAANRPPL